MFRKNINYVKKFENCNSIHTFFMLANIDVYLINKNNEILYVHKNLKPNKIIFPKKNVSTILETKTGLWNYKIGEKIKDV